MPRLVPLDAKIAMTSEQVSEELVSLITITDVTLAQPLRYTTSSKTRFSADPLSEGIVSSGHTYLFMAIGALLPNEAEAAPLTTTIVIENVSSDAAKTIRDLSDDAEVELAIVLASNPDSIVRDYPGFSMVNRTYAIDSVTIELSKQANAAGSADASEPWPGKFQTRTNAPGLHR